MPKRRGSSDEISYKKRRHSTDLGPPNEDRIEYEGLTEEMKHAIKEYMIPNIDLVDFFRENTNENFFIFQIKEFTHLYKKNPRNLSLFDISFIMCVIDNLQHLVIERDYDDEIRYTNGFPSYIRIMTNSPCSFDFPDYEFGLQSLYIKGQDIDSLHADCLELTLINIRFLKDIELHSTKKLTIVNSTVLLETNHIDSIRIYNDENDFQLGDLSSFSRYENNSYSEYSEYSDYSTSIDDSTMDDLSSRLSSV